MRIYEPQNVSQWVMQYLGNDHVLSPFAGNIRADNMANQMLSVDGVANQMLSVDGVGSSAMSDVNAFDPSAITELIRSIGNSGGGSSGGSGGSGGSSAPSNGIQWYDPWGRPIAGPGGVGGRAPGIRSQTGFISGL